MCWTRKIIRVVMLLTILMALGSFAPATHAQGTPSAPWIVSGPSIANFQCPSAYQAVRVGQSVQCQQNGRSTGLLAVDSTLPWRGAAGGGCATSGRVPLYNGSGVQCYDAAAGTINTNQPTVAGAAQLGANEECSIGWNWNFGKCIWNPLMKWIGASFLYLGGTILHWAGAIFNWLVTNVIVQFGTTIQALGLIEGIHSAWSVLRDISNIVIIGMFTFIAISIIIGNHTFGEKKLVAKVLVVAVLINFSLLFAKIIIDTSNFIAYQVYKSMSQSGNGNANIANGFLAATGITKAFNTKAFDASLKAGQERAGGTAGQAADQNTTDFYNASQGFFHGLVGGIMLLFAASVLLYGSYLIVARALLLVFLMLISALAFATYLIPQFSGGEYGWSAWWKSLINASIFGPLLMLLLYVSLVVIAKMPNATSSSSDSWLPLFSLAMGIGMLYVSFKVANSFAGKIAGFGMASGLVGKGLGVTMGGAGILGRQTLGWGATKFATSRAGRALATAPIIGRPMRSALYGAATGAYDARNLPGAKSFFKAAGMGVGDAAKDGYLKSLKGRQKAIKEKEEERVGFITAPNRAEKKIKAAAEGSETEEKRINSILDANKKTLEKAQKIRGDAANEAGDLKVKAHAILKKKAEEDGFPAPAFTDQQTLSETKLHIEEARRVALERGDNSASDELRVIAERMGELNKTIEGADKTITSLDTSTAENSRKLKELRPELERNKEALTVQKEAQARTLGAFQNSISKEFYGTLFGDRMLSTEVANDVIKSVQKSPDQKHAEHLMHMLHELEHRAHAPAAHAAEQAHPPAAGHSNEPAKGHAAPAADHKH